MSMGRAMNISIEPTWDRIDRVREQSSRFLSEQGVTSEVVDAITMVACELTENAVKYGSYDRPRATIELKLSVTTRAILLEVMSPMDEADADHLERLDRMIQWIRGHQDPFQAYLERLEEVSAQSLENNDSGLGLVRIAYEGQSILDFFVDEQNTVSISALYPLDASKGEVS